MQKDKHEIVNMALRSGLTTVSVFSAWTLTRSCGAGAVLSHTDWLFPMVLSTFWNVLRKIGLYLK